MLKIIITNMTEWSRGRNGLIRIPFLIWFAYVWARHVQDPLYKSILGALNLGFHELGHLVFSPLGAFIGVAGGTILQLLVPLYGIYNFSRQDDYFSSILCFGWLSTNFYDVATYVSDARSMSIPLVSPFGGHIIHDWNYMLSRLGILRWDHAIAMFLKICGSLSMMTCLLGGAWMIMIMLSSKAGNNGRYSEE